MLIKSAQFPPMEQYSDQDFRRRRTFAIISHPDAGKTTITEKLLLLGNAIQVAGTVKARKSDRHATSDWMAMERERGISVTSSVMQFPYQGRVVNLLDTPGHADFSEDTYRTLTAVDSVLMVIDCAKGVEERTIKLMDVCRLRDTPIITFINKLDREVRDPLEVLDEIERVLRIDAAPINWPIGMGRGFRGVYDLSSDSIHCYQPGRGHLVPDDVRIAGLHSPAARAALGPDCDELADQVELVRGASHSFCLDSYLGGRQTPVFFGTALGNFGVREMLDRFVDWAPAPRARTAVEREVQASEHPFTGFVFKIQANMDPRHRDRIAFLRICSGRYDSGMKMRHVRQGKDTRIADALTFCAGARTAVDTAVAGDIIGLHNHGSIQIGDTFTEGEALNFTGIPHFAPELFRRVRLLDPLKTKQLRKGLQQLAEEGSTQVFYPLASNDIILGAVGQLQFDVVAYRLKDEYGVEAVYEPVTIATAHWVKCVDDRKLAAFRTKSEANLALDSGGYLTYLAPTQVNLSLSRERNPDIEFLGTREH